MKITRISRLVCATCGCQQRVKVRSDGPESPCFACGPTLWLSLPTLRMPKAITVDPFWDAPQPSDVIAALMFDTGMLGED